MVLMYSPWEINSVILPMSMLPECFQMRLPAYCTARRVPGRLCILVFRATPDIASIPFLRLYCRCLPAEHVEERGDDESGRLESSPRFAARGPTRRCLALPRLYRPGF